LRVWVAALEPITVGVDEMSFGMLFASKKTRDKTSAIQKEHHKEYRAYFRNAWIAHFVFLMMIVFGVAITNSNNPQDWVLGISNWVGLTLFFVGMALINYMPSWIHRLGNEDDRVYFQKCIIESENDTELFEMGLGLEEYQHIVDIAFSEFIRSDLLETAAYDKRIQELHKKYDLRKIADEIDSFY